MITKDLYKYTRFRGRSSKYVFSLPAGNKEARFKHRVKAAKEQLKLSKEKSSINIVDETIKFTLEFLKLIGVDISWDINFNPRYELKDDDFNTKGGRCEVKKKIYDIIKHDCNINNINHIIWMKFTKKGHLGVVAASNDINFNDSNTASKLINEVGEEWDKTFVLIFPLPNISDGIRKDIECGVGNYLLENGIHIIDLYSHRYQ